MTVDEIRAALLAAGWKQEYETAYCILLFREDEASSEVYLTKLISRFRLSWQGHTYDGPRPSTLADLWTILRCVGAPVPETPKAWARAWDGVECRKADRPERIPCKGCGSLPKVSERIDGWRFDVWCSKCEGTWSISNKRKGALERWALYNGRRRGDWERKA